MSLILCGKPVDVVDNDLHLGSVFILIFIHNVQTL